MRAEAAVARCRAASRVSSERCASGAAVAGLPRGSGTPYPAEHRSLMEAMLATRARGAVLSEVPWDTSPQHRRPACPQPLGPSSGAPAAIVVEGDVDNGAPITTRYAGAQGRTVFAVPGNVHAPAKRRLSRLFSDGVRAVASPAEAVDVRGVLAPAAPSGARMLVTIGENFVHIDDMVARSGLGAAQVTAAPPVLTVRGLVRQVTGKRLARRGPGRAGHSESGGA
ncbi:MAG TPA: DNA-processing protein DprA [bacterium]|nr:DNA-processing protein DprA [bacterium]